MARLTDSGRLTITGLHNQIGMRTQGAIAAKWEAALDEAILLVLREEAEDDPVVVRAFKPRVGRQWQTEDAHAEALPSPDHKFIAIRFSVPNPSVAVLPAGRVVQAFAAQVNLGTPASEVVWAEDSRTLCVADADRILQWTIGARQFNKLSA